MTKSIVEDVVNEVLTRETPKTKFTLTHDDLDIMISDIAEGLEAAEDIERDSCEICGKVLEIMDTIKEHKRNQHGTTNDHSTKDVTH